MLKPDTTVSPSITDPKAQFVWHFLNGRRWPITLVVGDNWVTAEEVTSYTVNADEPATHGQVETMLIQAGGIGQWFESE
jgi:hypothetical protein